MEPVRPGLNDSSERRIELRNPVEPAWSGRHHDHDSPNRPQVCRGNECRLQKSGGPGGVGTRSRKAKTTRIESGRSNGDTLSFFEETPS